MTCPVFMPPQASKAQETFGQWSRPASLLMTGVRPNSPQTITETSLSSPRWCRSSTRAVTPWSSNGQTGAGVLEIAAVIIPEPEGAGHYARAGLDQPPRHQKLLIV